MKVSVVYLRGVPEPAALCRDCVGLYRSLITCGARFSVREVAMMDHALFDMCRSCDRVFIERVLP